MSDAWTAFYWGDYLSKTQHLTMVEHGAYLLLMSHYYKTGKPLTTNVERLYRVCNAVVDTERAAVDFVLDSFFVRDDTDEGCFRHPRIDRELHKRHHISEMRRKAVGSRADRKSYKCKPFVPTKEIHEWVQPQSQEQPPRLAVANKKKGNQGSRISADFGVTEEHRTWAFAHDLPSPDLFIEEFRDYWTALAGSRAVKMDWDATFRRWIRKAKETAGGNGNGSKPRESRKEQILREFLEDDSELAR